MMYHFDDLLSIFMNNLDTFNFITLLHLHDKEINFKHDFNSGFRFRIPEEKVTKWFFLSKVLVYYTRLLSIKGLVFPITNTCAFAFVITKINYESRQNTKVYLNIPAVHFGTLVLMTSSNMLS